MTEHELFKIIDDAIKDFIKNEGVKHAFIVENKNGNGWLVYSWRQLRWTVEGLNYFIEISPNFSKNEKIVSWNLYTAVSYDLSNQRFYMNKMLANKKVLTYIATNIDSLLFSSYSYIMGIYKEEIPFIGFV